MSSILKICLNCTTCTNSLEECTIETCRWPPGHSGNTCPCHCSTLWAGLACAQLQFTQQKRITLEWLLSQRQFVSCSKNSSCFMKLGKSFKRHHPIFGQRKGSCRETLGTLTYLCTGIALEGIFCWKDSGHQTILGVASASTTF